MDEYENNQEFLTMAQAAQFSGLHPHTIRKYADCNKIKCYKTPAGQRKLNKLDLEKFCSSVPPVLEISKDTKLNFLYSRVSSKKQLDDLTRQTEYLQSRKPEYASYISLTDVASGINFKRKGLQVLLDCCLQKTIGELVIAHRDRLCRFGFELLQQLVTKSGGTITVLDDETNKSTEQELAEDLLSIVHIYSCRQMGKRSYRKQSSNRISQSFENQDETFSSTENNS